MAISNLSLMCNTGHLTPTLPSHTSPLSHSPPRQDYAEERHLAALELTMKQKGLLEKTIMQCVFVSPPHSGKSSLTRCYVGELPTPSSPSTRVASKLVQVEIV